MANDKLAETSSGTNFSTAGSVTATFFSIPSQPSSPGLAVEDLWFDHLQLVFLSYF
jgi:hypothetical protein